MKYIKDHMDLNINKLIPSRRYKRSFRALDLVANALNSVNLPLINKILKGRTFDIVDFFSGCGGTSFGFHAVGEKTCHFRHVAAFDIDKYANSTFEKNFGLKPHEIDLSVTSPIIIKKIIAKAQGPNPNPLIVIGCAPCQGFSKHRKKDPTSQRDPRNHLVAKFAEIATALKPVLIIMENVPEILSEKYKPHYEPFKRKLENEGYLIKSDVINMANYGVPQKRQRALVLASRLFCPELPQPILNETNFLTVREAIGNLPSLEVGGVCSSDPMHKTSNHKKETVNILKKVPKDGGSRPTGVGPKCLDKVKGFYDVYGRLYWDRPSITITARCRTPSCGRYAHPEQNRGLSIREAALLQGFPLGFYVEGPFDDKYKQVGNAVPPVFSTFLAAHVLQLVAKNIKSMSKQI